MIIEYLEKHGQTSSLTKELSAAELLLDQGISALMENKLYWLGGREKWMDNYYLQRDGVLGWLPLPLRMFVGNRAWANNKAMLQSMGINQYSKEEAATMKRDIWESIASALEAVRSKSETKDVFWILGAKQATVADCVVFGFIVSVFTCTR